MQVELHKKEQQLERQSERLSVSQRVIAEQEEELAEVAKELEITERENTLLRESMEKILEENNYSRFDTQKSPIAPLDPLNIRHIKQSNVTSELFIPEHYTPKPVTLCRF